MAKNKIISEFEITLPQLCKFCESSIPLIDDTHMLCRKFGMVDVSHICKKFVYDPLKHIPPPPLKLYIPDDEELIFE